MSIDAAFIRRLLDFTDSSGVLTITTGFTPEDAAHPQPTAPIALRNQLRDIQQRLEKDGDNDRARLLEKQVDRLGDDFDGLTSSRAPGRGRALFLGLASGRTEHVNVQVPFEDRAVLRDRAFLRPIVAALDEGRPAGIAVASRDHVRILEWTLGGTSELATLDFELSDAQLADSHGGPVAANPARGQTSVSHRESFEDRIDDNRHRFLKQAAGTLVEFVNDRRWDRLVLAGSERIRAELEELLPEDLRADLLHGDAGWEDASTGVMTQKAWPLLRSVHAARERALIQDARERAAAGTTGVLGPKQVCTAANRGRVAHLLFARHTILTGYLAEDGTVHHMVGGPAAQAGLKMQEEPFLVERLIEKVLTMGGQVTRLDDDEAIAAVADHDGLAALLRW